MDRGVTVMVNSRASRQVVATSEQAEETMNAISLHHKPDHALDWRAVLSETGPDIETEGRACDRAGRFVADNLDRLARLGFFALGVPTDLGGGGASLAEMCAMLRALARHDGSTALALSMHTHQVMVAEWRRRNQGAPTEGLLKRVAEEGLRILSSGGSDWLPGSGRAEKVEGGYRIFARKVFASGAPDGGVMNTCAIFEDAEGGPMVLHFALPMKDPAVRILETWDSLGMRGTASHEVEIDGVFIPDAGISGSRTPGKWHPLFHIISMIAFPLIYSVYAGVADGARETALGLARGRNQDALGVLAVGDLEQAHAAMDVAWTAMVEAGSTSEPGVATTSRVMTLKGLVGRAALDVGTKALETAGGAGFHRKAGLEQRFRDLQGARYHPLTDRQQQTLAGRLALGLDADG
jgi:alkylation response protein AidB-like acyl-CoA dehydrogenase